MKNRRVLALARPPLTRRAKVISSVQPARIFILKHFIYNNNTQDLSWSKPAIKWENILHEVYNGVTSAVKSSIVTPVQEPIPGEMSSSIVIGACAGTRVSGMPAFAEPHTGSCAPETI